MTKIISWCRLLIFFLAHDIYIYIWTTRHRERGRKNNVPFRFVFVYCFLFCCCCIGSFFFFLVCAILATNNLLQTRCLSRDQTLGRNYLYYCTRGDVVCTGTIHSVHFSHSGFCVLIGVYNIYCVFVTRDYHMC